jgi:hypothetical protein
MLAAPEQPVCQIPTDPCAVGLCDEEEHISLSNVHARNIGRCERMPNPTLSHSFDTAHL